MVVLMALSGTIYAQSDAPHAAVGKPRAALKTAPTISGLDFRLPKHIQQNPMGYAPLCKIEVKIERQLPVGVWLRADGAAYRQVANPGLAYLRFRVPIGN